MSLDVFVHNILCECIGIKCMYIYIIYPYLYLYLNTHLSLKCQLGWSGVMGGGRAFSPVR